MRSHPDRLVLTVSVLSAVAIALVLGGLLSDVMHVEGHDAAYLIGGVIGFAAGFGIGLLTSRAVDRALR